MTTTSIWRTVLAGLIETGEKVAPTSSGADWRGRTTLELIGYRTIIEMRSPVVRSPRRKLMRKFLAGEAAWIASGDDRVATIAPVAPQKLRDFSDDGVRFFGAYGPRFVDQLGYVVGCLAKDRASRQAVCQIWRPLPPSSKDVPCTLSWQYFIRNDELQCVATMRSSDIWAGWVYDVMNFSMAAAVIALELRERHGIVVGLGRLFLTVGSQHLYLLDQPAAAECLLEPDEPDDYRPLHLADFPTSDDLVAHLWNLAHGRPSPRPFLRELFTYA